MAMSRGQVTRPMRLTRIHSQLAGAPCIMQGLDSQNRATEALPPDPVSISMAEVRHRLPRSHPMSRPKIKLILRTSRSPPVAQGENPVPSRKSLIRSKCQRDDRAATTVHAQKTSTADTQPIDDGSVAQDLSQIPESTSEPACSAIPGRPEGHLACEADKNHGAMQFEPHIVKEPEADANQK